MILLVDTRHVIYILLTISKPPQLQKNFRYLALHNRQVENPCNLPRPWPAKISTPQSARVPLSAKEARHFRTITMNEGEAREWKFFLLRSLPLLLLSSGQQS
jgi:hypothetical protein